MPKLTIGVWKYYFGDTIWQIRLFKSENGYDITNYLGLKIYMDFWKITPLFIYMYSVDIKYIVLQFTSLQTFIKLNVPVPGKHLFNEY